MIERIEWNQSTHFDELLSPFMSGKGERPLRITLHSDSLAKLSGEEIAAVGMLREFGYLDEVQVIETEAGSFPYIEIGIFKAEADYISVKVVSKDVLETTGIWNPRQLPDIAAYLVGQTSPEHQEAREMLDVLLMARAHCSLHRDILITSSPLLLEHRDKESLREANPRTPLEAIKIVGLFLRSRNIYAYTVGPKFRADFDRGLFYLVLARSRLPSMWQYNSACLAAGKACGYDLTGLSESILIRSIRALEARDAIGVQFHLPQNNNTRDQIMYHFDYLTLVLAGALDAQARVANAVYGVGSKEWQVSFRNAQFIKALQSKGALELHDFITKQRYKDVTSLIYTLRNTIHSAALKTTAYRAIPEPERSFIMVPQDISKTIWDATERLGSAHRWGLRKNVCGILFEPYSCATALVEESLSIIDGIAATTDIKRLIPGDQTIAVFRGAAPADSVFKHADRIALLG